MTIGGETKCRCCDKWFDSEDERYEHLLFKNAGLRGLLIAMSEAVAHPETVTDGIQIRARKILEELGGENEND